MTASAARNAYCRYIVPMEAPIRMQLAPIILSNLNADSSINSSENQEHTQAEIGSIEDPDCNNAMKQNCHFDSHAHYSSRIHSFRMHNDAPRAPCCRSYARSNTKLDSIE